MAKEKKPSIMAVMEAIRKYFSQLAEEEPTPEEENNRVGPNNETPGQKNGESKELDVFVVAKVYRQIRVTACSHEEIWQKVEAKLQSGDYTEIIGKERITSEIPDWFDEQSEEIDRDGK